MTSDLAMQMTAQLLWTGLLIAAPFLGVTLVVGLLMSLFQAVTQIQEMSLAFVPKLVAAVVTLVVFGPWMLQRLLSFASLLIGGIPGWV